MASFGGALNDLEARIAKLEKKSVVGTSGTADLLFDPTAPATTTVVLDQLDWTVSQSWEPYTSVSPVITDPADPAYPGGQLSTRYGRPEANLIGRMCVLSGVVRRKADAPALAAGFRHDRLMFGLPTSWRPTTSMILPCLMGNSVPVEDSASGVGTAWIEVGVGSIGGYEGGVVSYVAGTMSLSPTTGWIALQGIFPCHIIDAVSGTNVADSWDDAHFQTTWDSVGDDVTWDTYTSTG